MGDVFLGTSTPASGDLGPQDVGINTNTGQIFTTNGPLPEMRVGGSQPAIFDLAPSTGDNAVYKLRNTQGGINLITGGGNFSIQQTTPDGSTEKTWITCTRNAGTALFHDTEQKFVTHSRGVEVQSANITEFVVHNTGTTDPALMDARNNAGSARTWVGSSGQACFGTADANGNNQQLGIQCNRNGAVYLRYNGANCFQTLNGGTHTDGRFHNIINDQNADNILLLRTSHSSVNRGVRLMQEAGTDSATGIPQPWIIQSMNGGGSDIKSAVTGRHGGETIMHYNGGTRIHTTAEGGKVGKGGTSDSHLFVYNDTEGVSLWTGGTTKHLSHAANNGNVVRDFLYSSSGGNTVLNHGANGYASLQTRANGGQLNGAWTGTITRSAIKSESNGKVLITRDYANTILADAIELLANGDNAGALTMATDLRN